MELNRASYGLLIRDDVERLNVVRVVVSCSYDAPRFDFVIVVTVNGILKVEFIDSVPLFGHYATDTVT
jgi:hypothetical protein